MPIINMNLNFKTPKLPNRKRINELVEILKEKEPETIKRSDFPKFSEGELFNACRILGYSNKDENGKLLSVPIRAKSVQGTILGYEPYYKLTEIGTRDVRIRKLQREVEDLKAENATLKEKNRILEGKDSKFQTKSPQITQDERSRKDEGKDMGKSTQEVKK